MCKLMLVLLVSFHLACSSKDQTPIPGRHKVIVEIEVASAKTDGRSWDTSGGAPDSAGELRIGDASYDIPRKEDSYSIRHEIPNVQLSNGNTVIVELFDKDISNHDLIGLGRDTYKGQPSMAIRAGQANITLKFIAN